MKITIRKIDIKNALKVFNDMSVPHNWSNNCIVAQALKRTTGLDYTCGSYTFRRVKDPRPYKWDPMPKKATAIINETDNILTFCFNESRKPNAKEMEALYKLVGQSFELDKEEGK